MKTINNIENLTLPKELSKPSDNIWDFGILIHGEKKIGKTGLASEIERNFMMMAEPGAKSFTVYQKPVLTWDAYKSYIKLLEKDKFFKVVTVDPIDFIYKSCVKYVCQKNGMDHPSDEGYGKGWSLVSDEFLEWTKRLLACKKGVILISHSAYKEIKTRRGDEYSKILPTLPGGAWGVLEGMIDFWGHMYYDGSKRVMQIIGDEHVGAGHNIEGHFLYKDGTPIKKIPMGNNKKEAYGNFIKAFNNELVREKIVLTTTKRKSA